MMINNVDLTTEVGEEDVNIRSGKTLFQKITSLYYNAAFRNQNKSTLMEYHDPKSQMIYYHNNILYVNCIDQLT